MAIFSNCHAKLLDFPDGSDSKESACSAGDLGSILWSEDPLQKEMATTSVFSYGKSYEQRSLVGYSPWGSKQSGMTEWLTLTFMQNSYKFKNWAPWVERNETLLCHCLFAFSLLCESGVFQRSERVIEYLCVIDAEDSVLESLFYCSSQSYWKTNNWSSDLEQVPQCVFVF